MQALRLLYVVAAAIVLTAAIGGCTATVSTTELKVGECFNYTNTTDANGDPVNLPSPVDCAKPHSDEVFSVFSYPAPPDAGFPGYEAIGALQQTHCQGDFASYVGVSWDQSVYTIRYESPTEDSWAAGDHAIHCLLEDGSAAQLTGSARGSTR